jgi:hypothetical protein
MAKRIRKDPALGEDQTQDHNSIGAILVLGNCLRTLKLIVIIIQISFFVGVFFLIFCQLQQEAIEASAAKDGELASSESWASATENRLTFLDAFDFEHRDNMFQLLTVFYFSFTSLTTVGFGDFHPKSDAERVVTIFVLVFGVAIFSYIMGIFIEILVTMNEFNQEIDEGDLLTKFFGLIQRFNHGKPLELPLQKRVQEYFDVRW